MKAKPLAALFLIPAALGLAVRPMARADPVASWCAHIYTPSWGHYMTQVLPALIATAGPVLGRETSRPEMVMGHAEPKGRVILGTPELAK